MADRVKPGFLLGRFGFLAVVMAGMGIHGVVSFSVRERFHQTGIRIALGSTPHDVRCWVIGIGLRPVLAGLGTGLLLAVLVSGGLRSLLYGIRPTDPGTYAGVAGLFLVVALLSMSLPALRASRVDPVELLRSE